MENAENFIGYYVSLACDNDSVYEGEVGEIDGVRQLITLTHAHQLLPDGSTMKFPRITLTGNHIKNLKIIRERIQVMPYEDPMKQTKKENCKDQNQKMKLSQDVNKQKTKSPKPETNNGINVPSPRKFNKQSNTNCFGQEADNLAQYPDFDFEENLAKFDKHAVYEKMSKNSEELFANGISDYDRKMKAQENVLESEPVSLRQIRVPIEHAGKEYSTEDGFIIPSIDLALKSSLFAAAEKAGLSMQQLTENAGICVCQMALQLVGGSLRINPKNNHQRPEIVILAGSHNQGLQGICAARHLANHTAKVVLYLPVRIPSMQAQIDLYLKSGGKLIKSYRDLPSQPVDIVIDAMIGLDNSDVLPDWLPFAISWANQNKAPLLSIDPIIPRTKTELPDIKWSIAMGLPLIKAPNYGRLYLADIGIPRGVFRDVGIQYLSPFKDKFYIPLYDC